LDKPVTVDFAGEFSTLPPVVGIALNIPPVTAAQRKTAKFFADKAVDSAPHTMRPNSLDPNAPPTKPKSERIIFTPQETDQVIKFAKLNNYTVTQFVHAAVIHMNVEVAPENKGKGYTAIAAYDLRPYLVPPYNSNLFPATSYMVSFPAVIEQIGDTLLETTQKFKNYYTSVKATADWPAHTLAFLDDSGPFWGALPAPHPFVLSSVGLLDEKLKKSHGVRGPVVRGHSINLRLTPCLGQEIWPKTQK